LAEFAPTQRLPVAQALAEGPEQQGCSAPPQATQPVPTQRCPWAQDWEHVTLPGSPPPPTPPVLPVPLAASTGAGEPVAPSRPTGQGDWELPPSPPVPVIRLTTGPGQAASSITPASKDMQAGTDRRILARTSNITNSLVLNLVVGREVRPIQLPGAPWTAL
jgi:hypothetical protein